MQTPNTLRVAPYGEINIGGQGTFALIEGNAPWVFLRTGSDAVRVPIGNCINVKENYCSLVNPFPRPIEIIVARGWPVSVSNQVSAWNQLSVINMQSGIGKYRQAQATGLKYAVGVMMKRGQSQLEFFEGSSDGFSKVMIFSGAKKDFLSFKPVGCMEEEISLRFPDGRSDDAVLAVSGTYTDAMITDWIAASGYTGNVTTGPTGSHMHTGYRYKPDTETAVFFVREVDKAVTVFARLTHLGAGLEEFR